MRNFRTNFCFEKKRSNFVGTFSGSFLVFCPIFFGWVFKIAIYVSLRRLRTKLFIEENFIPFGHWINFFGVMLSFFRWDCQKCIQRVDRNFCGRVFFWKKLFFPSFPDIEREICQIWPEKVQLVCRNSILHVHRNIDGIFFWKKENTVFPPFSDKNVAFCRKFFSWLVKATPYVSVAAFWGKLGFLE